MTCYRQIQEFAEQLEQAKNNIKLKHHIQKCYDAIDKILNGHTEFDEALQEIRKMKQQRESKVTVCFTVEKATT